MDKDIINVNIIDRTEEEKNKDYEVACAEGLELSVGELRVAVQEVIDFKKREKELEKSGMIVSVGHTAMAGRVMLFCDVLRLIDIFGLE